MNRIVPISNSRKCIAYFHVLIILLQCLFPTIGYALTGGPSQPEVQSFEPVSTSEMVDLSTGDFVYNIPLLDVGGYPINISYHSGITADQEASWVGLGWNINPGVINRNMRGLPDDFKGDVVKKTFSMRDNWTAGVKLGFSGEVAGIPAQVGFGHGFNYNSYTGFGFERMLNAGFTVGQSSGSGATANLGISLNSGTDGLSISPSLSFNAKMKGADSSHSLGARLGLNITSKEGLKSMSLGLSASGQLQDGQSSRSMYKFSSSGSLMNFAANTYTPKIEAPRATEAYTVWGKIGVTAFGVYAATDLTGYYSNNKIMYTNNDHNAYGYMYSHNRNNKYDLLDFNREKDNAYSMSLPNLPLTNQTFDLYGATGQGVAGQFRMAKSDFDYVSDPYVQNNSGAADISSLSLGVEVGAGAGAHAGVDLKSTITSGNSGIWNVANGLKSKFRTHNDENNITEDVYFRTVGEKKAIDESYFNKLGGYKPISGIISESGYLSNQLKDNANGQYELQERQTRESRSTLMSFLTVGEAKDLGKEINVYAESKDNHIAELTVIKPDGTRYVYGKAAYNIKQKETVFNIEGLANLSSIVSEGVIEFENESAIQDHIEGLLDLNDDIESGKDDYVSIEEIPPYAYSYLLTEVFSADYVDVDNNGPTQNDIGTYTLFHYEEINGENTSDNYKWRVPYERNKVNVNQGLLHDTDDDKGIILEGEKQIYYLTEIETKYQTATFILGDERTDGVEADNLDSADGLKRLERIELRTGSELIKTVHFQYEQTLCPDIPNISNLNNGNGKLTLTGIYFINGQSNKGRFNSYKFHYDSDDTGPSYHPKSYDRWGHYSKEVVEGIDNGVVIHSTEFPYVNQGQNSEGEYFADIYAQSWNLSSIELPSGGIINVEYEADDYGYVQNKPAMQMLKVIGAGESQDFESSDNNLYSSNGQHNYLFFELDQPIIANNLSEASDLLKSQHFNFLESSYLEDEKIHFRFLVDLKGGNEEYIPGYADVNIENIGVVDTGTNNYKIGYIKLREETIENGLYGSQTYNPIVLSAWNFIRRNVPRLAYTNAPTIEDTENENILDLIESMSNSSMFQAITDFARGPFRVLKSKNTAKTFVPYKSYIRVDSPITGKKGGGVRVKRLGVSDNWHSSSEGNTREYKTSYNYVLDDGVSSSGVASYEPMVGGEENALRQPIEYSESRKLVPDEDYLLEAPYGESFYPSPNVVYSRVEVKTDYTEAGEIDVNRMGSTVHEYYTAKDFPVIVRKTNIERTIDMSGTLEQLILNEHEEDVRVSQGYVVELNDMHGKLKKQSQFDESGSLKSYVEQSYKVDESYNGFNDMHAKRLSNEVDVLDIRPKVDGSCRNTRIATVGVEVDLVADFRDYFDSSDNLGFMTNIGSAGFVPYITAIFSKSKNVTKFKSAVITKVINRYGLLDKVKTNNSGAEFIQKNMIWDSKTGEVLATSESTNFDKELYNYKIPAYHIYPAMGLACDNINTIIDENDIVDDVVDFDRAITGDELMVYNDNTSTPIKGWVVDNVNGEKQILDNAGNIITDIIYAKVLRSGNKNLQEKITVDIQGATDLCLYENWENIDVLNQSTQEYKDDWRVDCGCNTIETENPYVSGNKGRWLPWRTWTPLQAREYAIEESSDEVDFIKTKQNEDGFMPLIFPLVYNNSSEGFNSSLVLEGQTNVNTSTNYANNGAVTEERNILGIYSSAMFDKGLPVTVSANSEYGDSYFDGFEGDQCQSDGTYIYGGSLIESKENAHTGLHSLEVLPSNTVHIYMNVE